MDCFSAIAIGSRKLGGIEPQLRLPRRRVRTVTGKAPVSKDRPNVAVVLHVLGEDRIPDDAEECQTTESEGMRVTQRTLPLRRSHRYREAALYQSLLRAASDWRFTRVLSPGMG